MKQTKKLVVLSGAGVSQESGLSTFRDAGGLWEGHDPRDVATPEAWARDPELVLRFYNERRQALGKAIPNSAHKTLAELENDFEVDIVTQNVDDLHERGGSTNVLHLHGELTKICSSFDLGDIQDIGYRELTLGETCQQGHQLRPYIVWFGEAVPKLEEAVGLFKKADIVLIIGTSLQVYPAASLFDYARPGTPTFLIDPAEPDSPLPSYVEHLKLKASNGMEHFKEIIGDLR